jgi:hypothetical protein
VVTDYERAWTMLGAFVASKTQHGREGMLTQMAEIARECEVPSGELSRLLRLYGVEVERARSISTETDRAKFDAQHARAFDGGLVSPSDTELPEHHGPGGHDGHSNGHAAGNGRRTV